MMTRKEENTFERELTLIYEANKKHLVELMFFDSEIKFLKILLTKYFALQTATIQINKIQLIGDKLSQINLIRKNINTDALTHQGNLEAQFKGLTQHHTYFYTLESKRITIEVHDLEHQYRKVKSEIFQLSKVILSERNLKSNN
nr:hypothetical protein [Pseudopedobacter sp.]